MENICQPMVLQGTISYESIKIVEIVSAGLAALFGLLFLMLAVSFKFYKEFLFKIVIGITTTGLLFSITPFIRSQIHTSTDVTCNIFGLIETYWAFASLCWCSCFAHAVHLVAKGGNPRNVERHFWYYLSISTTVPAACVTYFILTESSLNCYESSTLYCRINYNNIDLQVFLVSMVVWLCSCLVMIVFYKNIRKEMNSCGLNVKHRVYVFPLVSLVCWLPQLYGYLQAYFSQVPPAWFIIIQTASLYLYGILNVLLYGFCKRARAECLRRFTKNQIRESQDQKEDIKQYSLLPDASMLGETKSTDYGGRVAYFSYNRTVCLSSLRDSIV